MKKEEEKKLDTMDERRQCNEQFIFKHVYKHIIYSLCIRHIHINNNNIYSQRSYNLCLFVSYESRVFVKLFETRERQKLIAVYMKETNQINNNQRHKTIRMMMMIDDNFREFEEKKWTDDDLQLVGE